MATKDKGGLAILIAAGKPKPPSQSGAGTDDETTTSEAGDEYAEAESSYPEFDIPRGLDLGDMDVGDEKEVLAKIRMKEGGTACVTQIEGVDLAGGAGVAPPGEAPGGAPPPPPPPGGPGGGPAAIRSRAIAAGLM